MEKKRTIIILMFIVAFLVAIFTSLIYYNNKYSVTFESGTSEIILTKYVKKNGKVEEPITPIKEGYVFKEWQVNGETYDFDSKVEDDIVLTAEWVKEEYVTITFNTNSDNKVEDKKILKGSIIEELPESKKEEHEFIGWYLNDHLYNNEEIYDDITLEAKYKEIKTIYEIGDKVIIIGNYSKSAYSTIDEAYNKRAIGWEREIIDIIEDSEFPYVVGNNTGVTGFFKVESIEKKEEFK